MEDLFLRKFNSYKDFKKQFIEWQDQNFQLITISKSDKLNPKLFCEATVARFEYERVFFQCKHGGKPRDGKKLEPTNDKARNNTHSACLNCPWKAILRYNKTENCLKFTTTELNHDNHAVSKEIYQAYTEVITRKLEQQQEAISVQKTLDQARSTNFNQVTTLNEQFGFNMSAQDLLNYKLKNKKTTSQTEQLWEEIKLLLQSDPNSVKIYKNSKNEVECIFIQTSFMRKMYKDHPEIQHLDSTFKV